DLLEQPDRGGVVHPRQQLGAVSAVAVLTGDGTAEQGDGVRRGLHEPAVAGPALLVEGEVDAGVHTAVTEVAVGRRLQTELAEQCLEGAQPLPQLRGRYGGVLPARVR